jgi:hypothetical protein
MDIENLWADELRFRLLRNQNSVFEFFGVFSLARTFFCYVTIRNSLSLDFFVPFQDSLIPLPTLTHSLIHHYCCRRMFFDHDVVYSIAKYCSCVLVLL